MSKINIVGLGSAGCNIANVFKKYPEYRALKLDTKGTNSTIFHRLKNYNHPELYENNPPKLKTFFRGLKGDVLFIVSGAGVVSGATLVILEQIKHCDISILYIRSDTELLSELRTMQEQVVFNVLQEYARSGVFKNMIIVSNPVLENMLGDLTLIDYYDKLNEAIVGTLHMINVFSHSESFIDNFSCSREIDRISTIGTIDLETGKESLFFDLDNISEKVYYYGINNETLQNDGSFFKKIKEQIKSKKTGDLKVSYGIFSTDYDTNYAFCVAKSSQIQTKGGTGDSL